ncbi:MAG: hypothetical protein Q8Q21_00700 [bacterium]|nr:hypothetical protein [bacterium]
MRTLLILSLFIPLAFLGGGCLTTSTSVEVRSVEEFPGGQIPDRRALAKAVNAGKNGEAHARADGNAAASATNTAEGGLAMASADGYSKNNPNDPGDPRDRAGMPNSEGMIQADRAVAIAAPDDVKVFGEWDMSGRGLETGSPVSEEKN